MKTTHSHRARLLAGLATMLLAVSVTSASRPAPAAAAGTTEVQVTAQITDTFSLTMRTDGQYEYGKRKAGKRYKSARVPLFRVRSTRPWVLTDSSDTIVAGPSGRDYPRTQVVTQDVHPPIGHLNGSGDVEVWTRYILDLTSPWARTLPEGTPIVATMRYTVVQQ